MQRIEAIIGPHSLERYAPLFIAMQGLLLIIGCLFWVDASQGATAFDEATWGAMAYSFQAEFWAMLNMGAAAISLIGLLNPILRKAVVAGGSLHITQHLALSYSAIFTGGDLAVGMYSSIFFLTIHILMTAGALAEWKQ